MNNTNRLLGLTLLKSCTKVNAYCIYSKESLDIDYHNREFTEDSDIILAGKTFTLFADDLNDSRIKGNTIYIKGKYVLKLS